MARIPTAEMVTDSTCWKLPKASPVLGQAFAQYFLPWTDRLACGLLCFILGGGLLLSTVYSERFIDIVPSQEKYFKGVGYVVSVLICVAAVLYLYEAIQKGNQAWGIYSQGFCSQSGGVRKEYLLAECVGVDVWYTRRYVNGKYVCTYVQVCIDTAGHQRDRFSAGIAIAEDRESLGEPSPYKFLVQRAQEYQWFAVICNAEQASVARRGA